MGRQPEALAPRLRGTRPAPDRLACGRYREPWFEPDFERRSTVDLGRLLVDEIENGIEDTGVRPGIIGELGADRDFVSSAEERVLRAAAMAQAATGLAITLHARASRVGMDQLAILEDAGADLRRVIVGHCDTVPDPDFHEALARRGAWVEFDTIRGKVPMVAGRRLDFIREVRRRGYLDRLLLSQDTCALSHLQAYGNTGYDYLATGFLELLRDEGLSPEELHLLFVRNPTSAIAIEA